MRKTLFIYFLLLTFFLSFATSGWEQLEADVFANISANISIPAVILLFSSIIVLAYVFGVGFNQPTLTLWAKEEFHHLLVSILLLLFFVFVLMFFDGAFSLFVNTALSNANLGSDPCLSSSPRQTALCEISKMSSKLSNGMIALSKESINYQRESAAYISYFGLAEGAVFSKKAYKRAWASMLDILVNQYMFPTYVSLFSQQLFFEYSYALSPDNQEDPSKSVILSLLLPMALICRFFPFLRDVGNFLFALAIGFYSLFPSLISLMYVGGASSLQNCATFEWVISDPISALDSCSSSYNLYVISQFYPFAFFYPNIALGITATFCLCLYKAMKVYG